MSFISWQYFIFLPIIIISYWLLPARRRLLLLLAGSYFFYGCWDVRFLALVLATTVIDYNCGLAIAGQKKGPWQVLGLALLPAAWCLGCYVWLPASGISQSLLLVSAAMGLAFFGGHEAIGLLARDRRPKYYLILSVVFCLAILGFFKYFNFFIGSFKSLLGAVGFNADWSLLKIILPVGISFYTFQSLGYVIDIYRGQSPACADLLTFATFDAFFPQMVSGPIERGKNLIPQLEQGASFRDSHLQDGLRLMLVGFFKKIFVADNCAILANYAFDPQDQPQRLLGGDRGGGLRLPDLRRFLRLHRYRPGVRQAAGDRPHGELPVPLFFPDALGILEQVAHFAVHLVPGLPVHPFGRQSRHEVGHPAESGHRHGPGRPLAWRQLGLRPLGGVSWRPAHPLPGGAAVSIASQAKDGAWTWRDVAAVPLMLVLTLVGWAIFRSPSVAHLGAWFGALGNWNAAAGALLGILRHLAADPHPAPDPAPGPDLEIPG